MELKILELDEVRNEVREHYAERVRNNQSCCGPDCCTPFYETTDLTAVPAESAEISYGCGNPTAMAALKPGEVVLDLGSGGGIDCFLAAERVGADGYVYGVDMTDEMLDVARRNAAKQGRTNVEFRKGYIESLPIEDGIIDVILSNCVVNLSPDKAGAFKEAFRVLKPGGRVAISDIVVDGDVLDLPVSEVQVRAALSWVGCIAGALTIDQVKGLLGSAGFTNIEVDIKHRYSGSEITAEAHAKGIVDDTLTGDMIEQVAQRFVSADIRATRPL